MTFDELKDLQSKYEKDIFSVKGVHGIGIGRKNGNENNNAEFIFIIYVENQSVISEFKKANIFSENSIPYQLITEPPLKPDILYINDDNIISSDQGRYRPLIGGIQLYLQNNKYAWIGTLGTFVKSNNVTDKNLYILSNLHVLKEKGLAVSQPLFGNKNIIGMVSKAKDFLNTDAALALVNDPENTSVNIIEGIGKVNEIQTITTNEIGKRVVKRGRTTALTEGSIETISGIFKVGDVYRYDCVCVRADPGKQFSDSGDSGSPVVLKQENKLIGLHFAGSREEGGSSIFCKIDNVFKNLDIKLPD